MVILIVGSSGLLGMELIRFLTNRGDDIYCVDSNPVSELHFPSTDNEIIINKRFDKIYCLVGFPCPRHYLMSPATTMNESIIAVSKCLDIAKRDNAHFTVTSSSEVYEDKDIPHDMVEEDIGTINLSDPRSCYKELKRYIEVLSHSYNREHGVRISINRIFNTYGIYRNGDTRLISNIISAIRNNGTLPIYGNGTARRSYCYAADTIKAIVHMSDNEIPGPMNIGNPYEEYSVNEVIEIAKDVFNTNIETQYIPDIDMIGTLYRKPDISKITSTGWAPETDLRSGLEILKEFM